MSMGASEKFSLKWNDFQDNVAKSFSQLRKQTGLMDVTLVSSDQKQVSAHRLVLSACSDFFKNIFYSNTHSHPLLYLDGVNSKEINLMLEYIYQGEVQICQEDLNRFLEIAKKFQLDGLLETEELTNLTDEKYVDLNEEVSQSLKEHYSSFEDNEEKPLKPKERSVKVCSEMFESSNAEVEAKFLELVVKEDWAYRCTVCEKMMQNRKDMKLHVETHLTGLSYDCPICGKNFRLRKSLISHKSKQHKHD